MERHARSAFLPLTIALLTLLAAVAGPVGATDADPEPDTTPPVIAPHALVDASASGFFGGYIAYEPPLATDDVDGSFPATCAPAPAALFPIGDTNVTCTASDAAGNAAEPTTFVVRVVLRGVGTVGAEQATYKLSEATLGGIEGAYRLLTPDGNPLEGVNVTVRIIRQVQFVGFLDAEQFVGRTDAQGELHFAPSRAFTLPTSYLLLATPSHPLLVDGDAHGRYTVTAG